MDISISKQLEEWGEFKVDEETFQEIGKYTPTAIRIFDKVGWK